MSKSKILGNLKTQLQISQRIIEDIKVGQSNIQQYYSIVMFQEILLLSNNCIIIFEADKFNISGIPRLIRGIFEITIDIVLNCDDINYNKNISLYSHNQAKKQFSYLLKRNKFSSQEKTRFQTLHSKAENETNRLKSEMKQLKVNVTTKLDQKIELLVKLEIKKTGKSDSEDDIRSLYNIYRELSARSHPNISAMLEKYEDSKTLTPTYKEYDYYFFMNILSQMMNFSINNMQIIFPSIKKTDLDLIQGTAQSIEKEFRDYEKSVHQA